MEQHFCGAETNTVGYSIEALLRPSIDSLLGALNVMSGIQDRDGQAHLQYEGGHAPYSTVLQAEQQLFPSEFNAVQTRMAQLGSVVNICKAMGGGWQAAVAGTAGP